MFAGEQHDGQRELDTQMFACGAPEANNAEDSSPLCSGRSLAIRRASKRAMDLQGWLATVLLVLALVGCVEGATGLGQPPYAPDAPDNSRTVHDRGGDGAGSGM